MDKNSNAFIWNGTFASWAEAAESARQSGTEESQAFDSRRWLNKQAGMLGLARQGIMPRFTSLPSLIAVTGPCTVVDFGGGSGWTYEILVRSATHDVCSYQVVEQPTAVDFFAGNSTEVGALNFISFEDVALSIQPNVDVFYTNSTLQYLPTNQPFLEMVTRSNPRWILIDDYQKAQTSEFFTNQNYYGSQIPCRFMDPDSLRHELSSLGYGLNGQWPYPASFGGELKAELGNVTLKECRRDAPISLLFERHRDLSGRV